MSEHPPSPPPPIPPRRGTIGARGQATPLLAIALLLAVLVLVPVSRLARTTIERAEAQTAADATALAGARHGEAEARRVAARNGARVLRYEALGSIVEVVVGVGGRRATARAAPDPAPSLRPFPASPVRSEP